MLDKVAHWIPYYHAFWHMQLVSEHAPLLEYRRTEVNRNMYDIGSRAFSINPQNALWGVKKNTIIRYMDTLALNCYCIDTKVAISAA